MEHTASANSHLLVVDDDPAMVASCAMVGRHAGFTVSTATGGQSALECVAGSPVAVVLLDVVMPGMNGLEVLRRIRAAQPRCRVIIMTGLGDVAGAVEAMRLGAHDYWVKPLSADQMLDRLRALAAAASEPESAEAEGSDKEVGGLFGRSSVMRTVFRQLRRTAPYARTVLITGETGTGKERVAQALHHLGPRAAKPLLSLNCSALVEGLAESQLFGYVRGAFTGAAQSTPGVFEAADGGVLFLDEVGELPLTAQAKLLRVLDSGEVLRVGATESRRVDVTVFAATHRDLLHDVSLHRFREDLFYRLNVVSIVVPPLRDRRDDIPLLARMFVQQVAARMGRPIERLHPDALARLTQEAWRGNVRELQNVIERACIAADGAEISRDVIDQCLARPVSGPAAIADRQESAARRPVLAKAEIMEAMDAADGSRTIAAHRLGISRRALFRLLKRHGLS